MLVDLKAIRVFIQLVEKIVAIIALGTGKLVTMQAWIASSHEHFDGSGYPCALAGEDIPQAARILLVADAFDAMTSDRSYRRALSIDAALTELRTNAGAQFDPACVVALCSVLGTSDVATAR